jgi:hypothetical protein
MKTYVLSGQDESLQSDATNLFSESERSAARQVLLIVALSILLVVTTFVIRNASVTETHPGHFLARVTH